MHAPKPRRRTPRSRGRNPIQYGTLSDGDAAGIISEIFGGAGADTIRGALGATDGIPDKIKEKILCPFDTPSVGDR